MWDTFGFTEVWLFSKGISVGSLANDLGYWLTKSGFGTAFEWVIYYETSIKV